MFEHYLAVVTSAEETITNEGHRQVSKGTDAGTSYANLKWLCETAITEADNYPIDKLSRWLGFVQGVLIGNGVLDTRVERDRSRPLFHAAYEAEGIQVPPTREREEGKLASGPEASLRS